MGKYLHLFGLCLVGYFGTSESALTKDHDSIINYTNNNLAKTSMAESTRDLLRVYTDLFMDFPLAFFPYKRSRLLRRSNLHKFLLDHICTDDMSAFCKSNDKYLKGVLKKTMDRTKYPSLVLSKLEDDLNNKVKTLRPLYREFQEKYEELSSEYDQELTTIVEESTGWKDFNLRSLDLWEKKYSIRHRKLEKYFLERTSSSPYMILRSSYIKHFIIGGFYSLESIDIIHSLKSLVKELKKKYLTELQIHKSSKKQDNWIFGQYMRVTDKIHWQYLKNYNVNDSLITRLILAKKYQQAIWRLRFIDKLEEAENFEEYLVKDLFDPKNCSQISPLNMGFTRTLKASFLGGISSIYKPRVSYLRHPVEYLTSNYKMEIAAYEIDKLLNLNLVPLTFMVKYGAELKGSLQYFIDGAYRARDMGRYNGSKPHKFSKSLGRNLKTNNILFFDWLMSNYDRNVDNYLILPTGKIVLIDHGFVFINRILSKKKIKKSKIYSLVPSKKIFRKLKMINERPDLVKTKLMPWLSETQVALLNEKIQYFVDKVNVLIKSHGEIRVFSKSIADELRYSKAY